MILCLVLFVVLAIILYLFAVKGLPIFPILLAVALVSTIRSLWRTAYRMRRAYTGRIYDVELGDYADGGGEDGGEVGGGAEDGEEEEEEEEEALRRGRQQIRL